MTIRALAIAGLLLASAGSASAASFSGTFAQDNQKAGYVISLATAGVVSFASTGYAGGGFDPILTLYDGSGLLVTDNDDDIGPDSLISLALTPGKYTVFLTQYNNFGAILLANGFAFDNEPNFRGGFIDINGNQRTGDWAFDITGAGSIAAVPEPATWALMIGGFGMVGFAARRRRTGVVAA